VKIIDFLKGSSSAMGPSRAVSLDDGVQGEALQAVARRR
jgi:hypothetical protein